MLHLEYLKERSGNNSHSVQRAAGRFYTGDLVGQRLARQVATTFHSAHPSTNVISVADPFGGDGRLMQWIIEAWMHSGFPDVHWDVTIWDIDDIGFNEARSRLNTLAARYDIALTCRFKMLDTFSEVLKKRSSVDLVLTNPPWELLKPDHRELHGFTASQITQYKSRIRLYDQWLGEHYPLSQPRRKFAGWGTNLSRVGLEACLSLVRPGGVVGAVLPASFLADDQTAALREHLLTKHTLHSAAYYPAEAKLYGSADVASITMVLTVLGSASESLTIATHNTTTRQLEQSTIQLDLEALRNIDFVMPIAFGAKSLTIIHRLAQRHPTWLDLESGANESLWAGREIDETGIARWLRPGTDCAPRFIKGRMIGRYAIVESPAQSVKKPNWSPPSSTMARRIAWRDVSRPSQERRMIATLIDPGCVAGNSLGVAYFRDFAETPLLALLGVMNSLCFEFQLRAHLATSHVSLSSLRKVAVPSISQLREEFALAALVAEALKSADSTASKVDAYVARNIYRLEEEEYQAILDTFTSFSQAERHDYLKSYRELQGVYQVCKNLQGAHLPNSSEAYALL